jgi:hypothetical protein
MLATEARTAPRPACLYVLHALCHCRAARALDTLMKELCVPLGAYIKGFPQPERLHPFERALLELTVGPGTYEQVLARVEALRRSTVEVLGHIQALQMFGDQTQLQGWARVSAQRVSQSCIMTRRLLQRAPLLNAGGQGICHTRLPGRQQEGSSCTSGGGVCQPAGRVQPWKLCRQV